VVCVKWPATIFCLLALTTAAQAGDNDAYFICEQGAGMGFIYETREARITRPGKMTVAIPFGGAAGRHSWWSPYEDSDGCERAPCAEEWAPKGQPRQVWFEIDEGKRVNCLSKD
jgi:hypothetical protein